MLKKIITPNQYKIVSINVFWVLVFGSYIFAIDKPNCWSIKLPAIFKLLKHILVIKPNTNPVNVSINAYIISWLSEWTAISACIKGDIINEINIENITLNTLGVPFGNITFIQLKNVNILINTNIIYLIPLHLLLYS